MGCACSAPADDFDDALEPEAFTGPSRTMLARPKVPSPTPRVFLPEAVKMSPRNARGRPPAAAAGKRHVECPFLSRDSTSNTLTRVFPPLARISQPRVLAVIAAWHAADDPESASAIPRTRSKTPPGPLEEVAGKPMVFHAWHAAHAAKCVTRCVVATDDDAVETTALAFGARVVRVDDTKTKTKNEKNRNRFFGSVAGAARALAASNAAAFDVVAVVDADEAFVEAHHIERVADAVINGEAQSATCTRDVADAADARNDAGRVFVRAENGASAASGYATVASVFVAGTDADRHGALADETSVFVGVEVGVRSYLTSALLEIIDGAPPRTNQKPEGSERSARGFRNRDADITRNDPTREALRLGWRVAAVRAEARNRLGGFKTQRSLDARNAEIAAGEIRFVPLF